MAMHHLQSFQVYSCDKQDDAKELDTPLHCLSLNWNFQPADSNSIYNLLSKQFPVVELAQCLLYICNQENNYQYSSKDKFQEKRRFLHILEHVIVLLKLATQNAYLACTQFIPQLSVLKHHILKLAMTDSDTCMNHFLSSIPLYSLHLISLCLINFRFSCFVIILAFPKSRGQQSSKHHKSGRL